MKLKKYKKSVLVLAGCTILGIAMMVNAKGTHVIREDQSLERKSPGSGDGQEELILSIPELEEEETYLVAVPEQILGEQERKALFQKAEEEIESVFLAGNKDMEHIETPVKMAGSYADGLLDADWVLSDYEVMNTDGTLNEALIPEEGVLLTAEVTLHYGEYEYIYSFPFRVVQRTLAEKEKILRTLESYFIKEGTKEGKENLELPREAAGHAISWQEKQDKTGMIFIMLGVLAAVLIPFSEKSKENEAKKKRERQLLIDYPEMVNKLALLLGAGMTVSTAWERIVTTYVVERSEKKSPKRFVYEEMQITLREMQDGMAERKAYERFGERCILKPYRKLTALIVQNLRKGSAGLTKLMEAEADDAFALRKNLAKRLGEEAGTKLLGPMILSLGIVIVIIMVPAVLSFYS